MWGVPVVRISLLHLMQMYLPICFFSPVYVPEWSHVHAISWTFDQVTSQIPHNIVLVFRSSVVHSIPPLGGYLLHWYPAICCGEEVKVPVDLVVGSLSDERTVFRENLVSRSVASEFVEPIAAGECVFPYFRTTESLEFLDPQFSVQLYHAGIGRHFCDVGPRQCDEPNVHATIVNLLHGTLCSLPAWIFGIAFSATLRVDGLPFDPLPEEPGGVGCFLTCPVVPSVRPSGLRTGFAGEPCKICLILF